MQDWARPLLRTSVGLATLVGCLGACSSLLGIDDVQCAPDSAECAAGEQAPAPVMVDDDSCSSLCTNSAGICQGNDAAYTTNVVCLGVCSLFSDAERSCRFGELASARDLDEPATHCPAVSIAGSRANGARACGTVCETYCRLLSLTCPEAFGPAAQNPSTLATYDGQEQCMAACQQRGDTERGFSVQDRAGDTTQCRLWHLAQATVDPLHCEHARGGCPCGTPEVCNATLAQ